MALDFSRCFACIERWGRVLKNDNWGFSPALMAARENFMGKSRQFSKNT
jgi:hypothetical protein